MPPSRTCMHPAHAGTSRERSKRGQRRKRSWPCCRFAFRWAFKLAPRGCRSLPRNWNAVQRARNRVNDFTGTTLDRWAACSKRRRRLKAITVEPKKAGSVLLEEVAEPDEREGSVLVEGIAVG